MLGRTYDGEVCSMARALEVVGERWTLLIVRDALFAGATRFVDFQRGLGIATNILTTRLEHLVGMGVMERRRAAERGAEEYHLTDSGRDLVTAVVALTEWGDRWRAPAGPPILYRHGGCGGAVHAQAVCATCGPVGAAAVAAEPGPGMPLAHLEGKRARRAGRAGGAG
ncbi:winged helix-turn-helix transcriptional regulator [Pedococcus sp. NPDC057267]|uniref:winged helix-turn-helix transcriptional regulator n=1 Tax=Pedococcus sp. NPDC057267 TaxID=3346077 RepID=UPI003626F2CA